MGFQFLAVNVIHDLVVFSHSTLDAGDDIEFFVVDRHRRSMRIGTTATHLSLVISLGEEGSTIKAFHLAKILMTFHPPIEVAEERSLSKNLSTRVHKVALPVLTLVVSI